MKVCRRCGGPMLLDETNYGYNKLEDRCLLCSRPVRKPKRNYLSKESARLPITVTA